MGFRHQPDGYRCPFCRVAAGEDLRDDYTKQTDVVFRDGAVTAFVSSAWWPANPGHVLYRSAGENYMVSPELLLSSCGV